jgi:hypothetical protein
MLLANSTLWDFMQKLESAYLFRVSRTLEQVMTTLSHPVAKGHPVTEAAAAGMVGELAALRGELEAVDLPFSVRLLDRVIVSLGKTPPPTHDSLAFTFGELAMRIEDELKEMLVLQVGREQAKYYTDRTPFGPEVAQRFPGLGIDDLEEMSKCFALERYTACVFHVMRVLEVGLQALATKLKITLDRERNWRNILNSVQGAIKGLPRTTAEEKAHLGLCSEVAAHLQNVKDAWRNDVMHPRASYTEAQALDVMRNGKALMAKLAGFV